MNMTDEDLEQYFNKKAAELKAANPLWYSDICQDKRRH